MPATAPPQDPEDPHDLLDKVAGYLNFSEGAPDATFLGHLSDLYAGIEGDERGDHDSDTLDVLLKKLSQRIDTLQAAGGAFADVAQARGVLQLVQESFRPAYREFHSDLLWHRRPGELWRPFFLGRVFEAVLAQGPPWDETERIVPGARDRLDDYIGYRPVAVLETKQKVEPYRHEWVRPIPLAIQRAGVAHGPYAELIGRTLGILQATDPSLLRSAWLDPELIDELAVDPRAYDFDHPAGKRPNHHFGQWDPNHIDSRGYYRRFVLQPIALEAMMSRVEELGGADGYTRGELLFEASAVLAGTMLMASGTSGDGPGRHSSEVTLATLLPHIAQYRDAFYQQLLDRAEGAHGERLRAEAARMRQPFAGARQHLNHELARRRATQLQHVHLAQLFARMGYPDAALRQAQTVRVASARMLSQVYCRLADGHRALDRGDLAQVSHNLPEIEDLLSRGIECGALVDPWNVVGFGGNFSLFPAIEDSVHDYRVDDLIELVEQVLDLCSRAWAEAAAVDDSDREDEFSKTLGRISDWWDQFATPTVSDVRRLVGKEIEVSTNLVAGALNAWHKAGAAAGDVGFWRLFVEQFDTPKAFQLVVEALLDQDDRVASSALMMQWVSQADLTPLEDGDASLYPLAERWLQMVEAHEAASGEDQWPVVVKFFAHLEASAEEAWHAPAFELDDQGRRPLDRRRRDGTPTMDDDLPFDEDLFDEEVEGEVNDEELDDGLDDALDDEVGGGLDGDFEDGLFEQGFDDSELEEDGEDELDNLFSAAYEGVTFRDSSDDGMDSAIFEPDGGETEYELEEEAERIGHRLALLAMVARLWKRTAINWGGFDPRDTPEQQAGRREQLEAWQREATSRYSQLGRLLEAVHQHRIPTPRGVHESMVEYDRRRRLKDSLLEQIIATCVEMSDAGRLLRAAAGPKAEATTAPATTSIARTIEILRAVLAHDAGAVRERWGDFCQSLAGEPLLYIPLAKGGDPGQIVKARALHQLIHDLAGWLPRLGLLSETCRLLDVAQRMETEHPVGRDAMTEYDRLFENGYQAIVRCLVASADDWDAGGLPPGGAPPPGIETPEGAAGEGDIRQSDTLLVQALQDLTESQLDRWLRHSKTVRLSVVEKLAPDHLGEHQPWDRFVSFIKRYGGDLFTQKFLAPGNLRAILHQGVAVWLSKLESERDHQGENPFEQGLELRLLDELGGPLKRDDAVTMLTIAIEAVVENYREYRDYNTTTTQSDHGEMLYTFVDFLRLRTGYDRIAWKLKPVFLAHKILVRQGRAAAAEMWRRVVADRTADPADLFATQQAEICEKYGMRLPTVAERLSERFIRPLTIDRLRSLVRPAMAAVAEGPASGGEVNPTMALLEDELDGLMSEPTGAGLDVPDWIVALEDEVTQVRGERHQPAPDGGPLGRVEQVRLTWSELQQQLGSQ
ncbi:MAG: hypothetical protein AAGB00_03965 [Planctomycetota bacterium]